MSRSRDDELLLGEWACLGIIAADRTHGFDVARRLSPEGDIGRVWSMSRALTYRAIDQLAQRDLIAPVSVEQGRAGGSRTIYAVTRGGRARLRSWVSSPVEHLRDLRSELLLKLVIGELNDIDTTEMLRRQRTHVARLAAAIGRHLEASPDDLVVRWRFESSQAALRFLDGLR